MSNKPTHYGFVYLWRDRKHNRYYVGSHWGPEDDGYICSSSWMKRAYTKRPNDFRRRILKRIYTTRRDLLQEEQRYLDMIKTEEAGVRYYNVHLKSDHHWHADPERMKDIGSKISKANKGRVFGPCTEETKAKISAKNSGKKRTPEQIERIRQAKLGGTQTAESNAKRSEASKRLAAEGRIKPPEHTEESRRKRSEKMKGHQVAEETREKIAKATSKPYLITFKDGRQEIVHGLKAYGVEQGIPYVTLFKAAQKGHSVPKYGIETIAVQ